MPKVSVIIPAYNALRYLPETIDSLLGQTFRDFEVIIINDGSTDDIEGWFQSVKDPRLKLISQVNQGQSKARNVGLENAQGELIAFLDADDLWEPSKLEKQISLLMANPQAGVVYTWVAGIDSEGILRGRIIKNDAEGNVWKDLTQHNILECGSTPLIRRTCFEQVGGFDERLPPCEDLDLWLRIACHYDFLVVKEPLVYYRQHASSSGKNWQIAEKNYMIALEKAFDNPPPAISLDELELLKSKAFAMAYLRFLAWSALQSGAKDYKTAIAFRQKAQQYYPKIIFEKDYLRLSIAIWVIKYLKPHNYDRFISLMYSLRRRLIN
ncbi:MAG: glycosyltransferase [Cyanobacteria bacterium J069]|nr:MAG: glycosyltransferase [Cyanobacteria bacterium J069]